MNISRAMIKDLNDLITMGEAYFKTCRPFNQLTFCRDRAEIAARYILTNNNHITVIARKDNIPVGFQVWVIDSYWTKEKIANELLLYVKPEFRNKRDAKKIIDFGVDLCKLKDARVFICSNIANLDDRGVNARAYNMLLQRCNFNVLKNSNMLYKIEG